MRTILCTTLVALVGCNTPATEPRAAQGLQAVPSDDSPASETPLPVIQRELAPLPWTRAFETKALLLADQLLIEGPPGLLEHLALVIDDTAVEQQVTSTSRGLRTVVRPRPTGGAAPPQLVQGQLDAWQLAAYEEIVTVVLREGEDVRIVARGQVLWQDTDGTRKRGPELVFQEKVETPTGDDGAQPTGR